MLVITDSGLGGLAVCAAVERASRESAADRPLRITYVNAWPEEGRGYNDLPDAGARAAVFDRALDAIDALGPDRVVIACNTLSILYPATARSRRPDRAPVQGIIDAGVDLFERALRADPSSSIVLVGTRTTVESRVHRDALVRRGIEASRVRSAACHGLATAIENDLRSDATRNLIEICAERAAATITGDGPVLLGLCCTHYGMAAGPLVEALGRRVPGPVSPLDPNLSLVGEVLRGIAAASDRQTARADAPAGPVGAPSRRVTVLSKVVLPAGKRENVAAILEPVSPATAIALRGYVHVPDLF